MELEIADFILELSFSWKSVEDSGHSGHGSVGGGQGYKMFVSSWHFSSAACAQTFSQHHWWLCCTRIPLPRLPSCPWESWYFWVAVVFYPVSSSELVQSKGSVSGEVILPCGTCDRGSVFGSWWWSLRHLRGRKGLQWRCWGCLSCRTGHNFSWQNPSRVLMFFLSKVQLSDPLRRTGISTALHTLILM